MREFFSFLKTRKYYLGLYLLSVLIILLLMELSHQSMEIAWYMVLLISTVMLGFLIIDCYVFLRRLHQVKRINVAIDELGVPANEVEKELLLAIELLRKELFDCKQLLMSNRNAELDYYTLWVHQIKTPISAMRLILQDMDDEKSAVLDQELFKIEQYADLALRYVRLKDIGNTRIPTHCDLNKIVQKAVKKYALLFVYRGLSIDISPLPSDVPSDEQWLCFIIEQLLSNAIKYTHKGGIRIYPKGAALVIEDSGIGIRQEDMPRIFEKGYTGYNGRLDSRASGIGLYLCRRTAEGLGIELSIESEIGKGTRALLRFPKNLWAE